MSDNDNISKPGDLEFDEATGEISLELNLNPKENEEDDDSKAAIGHVERMKQKRQREKMGLEELEDEDEEVESTANDEDTGDIDISGLDDKKSRPKAKVEKVAEAEEFRPKSMEAAREAVAKKTPKKKKVEPEKSKELEDALGLNDGTVEVIEEDESEQDAATRRVVLDDLMFEDGGDGSTEISPGTDQADHDVGKDDLEALIADDEEDDDYQIEAGDSAAEGVQVAGSEVNFKKEKLEVPYSPFSKQQKPEVKQQAPKKNVHPKCNFCKTGPWKV